MPQRPFARLLAISGMSMSGPVPFVNQVKARMGTPVLERAIGMAKFICLYRGPATSMSDVAP